MELVKDYDIELTYHKGKANVVANALSRKTSHSTLCCVVADRLIGELPRQEVELIQQGDLEARMSALTLTPIIFEEIRADQIEDVKIERIQ